MRGLIVGRYLAVVLAWVMAALGLWLQGREPGAPAAWTVGRCCWPVDF